MDRMNWDSNLKFEKVKVCFMALNDFTPCFPVLHSIRHQKSQPGFINCWTAGNLKGK